MSRILVVDDESLMREFLTESLVSQGYDVDSAGSGARAVELMNTETYDLVLTDFKMPKVTGMDVLKKAREKMPDCKVVIMTAYGTVENAVEAMKIGAFDYITKPFSVDEILILVRASARIHVPPGGKPQTADRDSKKTTGTKASWRVPGNEEGV